jgi:hypothetical protein
LAGLHNLVLFSFFSTYGLIFSGFFREVACFQAASVSGRGSFAMKIFGLPFDFAVFPE